MQKNIYKLKAASFDSGFAKINQTQDSIGFFYTVFFVLYSCIMFMLIAVVLTEMISKA